MATYNKRGYKTPKEKEDNTFIEDVKVDENGTGSFIRVTKGINESQYTSIIKQRLASRDIQFNTSGDESIVNIQIVFKVN